MKIGISGDLGSFSEQAGLKYAQKLGLTDFELIPLIDMQGVMKSVNQRIIDVGIIPVVNFNSGLVWPAFESLGKYNFSLVDEIHLEIEQYLFAKTSLKLDEIKQIYSYAPAFNQCKKFIANQLPNVQQIDWGDMAKAARDLFDGILPDGSAILGPISAAKLYNLVVISGAVQDRQPNTTIFVVVRSKQSG